MSKQVPVSSKLEYIDSSVPLAFDLESQQLSTTRNSGIDHCCVAKTFFGGLLPIYGTQEVRFLTPTTTRAIVSSGRLEGDVVARHRPSVVYMFWALQALGSLSVATRIAREGGHMRRPPK